MKKNYTGTYFSFSKNHFTSPERIGHYDLYQVGELEMSENTYISEHRQVCFEISYILSGEGTFSTGKTVMPVSTGDIHIISPEVYHEIKAAKTKGLRFAFLGFSFGEDCTAETFLSIRSLFLENPERTVHDNGEIGRLFSMLIDENYNGAPNSAIVCESIINCILVKTERLFSGSKQQRFLPRRSKDFIGQPLYDIIRFIDQSTPKCPSVSEICAKFSYSESYISHLFKNKLGIGIQEYIIDSKLKYAQTLLLEEKQTISEIAHILGYGSSQSFCKAFVNKYGTSPTQYRQNPKKAD